MRVALWAAAIALIPCLLFAGQPVQKGSGHWCATCESGASCHHRHCKHCSDEQDQRANRGMFGPRAAPVGPIVDSYPIMRAVPSMVSMPMMAMQTGVVADQAPAGAARSDQEDRIDELDARVEALHLRMQTILRSVELQTQILQELRDRGSIGGTLLPTGN